MSEHVSYFEDALGNSMEQLKGCAQCGSFKDWYRPRTKGRKPKICNDCVELNARPKTVISAEERVDRLMLALASRGNQLSQVGY